MSFIPDQLFDGAVVLYLQDILVRESGLMADYDQMPPSEFFLEQIIASLYLEKYPSENPEAIKGEIKQASRQLADSYLRTPPENVAYSLTTLRPVGERDSDYSISITLSASRYFINKYFRGYIL